MLGGFSLNAGEQPLTHRMSDRMQAVFVYLLLHRAAPQSRQHLAFQLWPDSIEGQARSNLRNVLSRLNQLLPEAERFIEVSQHTLAWRADAPYTLDLADFEGAITAASNAERAGDAARARADLERAVAAYGGDLLPSSYEEWVLAKRETLRQEYSNALKRLADLLEQAGEPEAALRQSQRLVQHDALDEESYARLMRLHALAGDRAGVRRVYDQCVAALERELGVEPSAATERAFQQWLRWEAPVQEPAATVVGSSPPPPSPPSTPTPSVEAIPAPTLRARPLPRPSTPLIGREEELAELGQVLTHPAYRLITFSGPGGIGKTRLAMEVALAHQGAFEDGAVWVSLASVPSPDLIAPAIADAMGLTLHSAGTVEEQLLHHLQARKLLLALDNFEHLLDGAELLSEILQQAPDLKILATSRVRVNLQEEWVWELWGLSLPKDSSEEALAQSGAVELFLKRARQANRDWTPARAEQPLVARICELVDGMPLGIELAAAWVRMLPLSDIVQEIENNLDFLQSSLRNVPARHRSLRAIFDHSWALLTEQERLVLCRLSVFRAGFSREAAEHVAGASLLLLTSLVDKSLMRRDPSSRYDLHEVVRQYAALHLAEMPQEVAATEERHGRYYLSWLRRYGPSLRSPTQAGTLAMLQAEINNLRHAWEWGVNQRQVELLSPAAGPFLYSYELKAWYYEGEELARRAAQVFEAALPGTPEGAIRSFFLAYQAWYLQRFGRFEEAYALIQQSLPLFSPLPGLVAHACDPLIIRGFILMALGRTKEAQEALRETLGLARELGDVWSEGASLMIGGQAEYAHGALQEADKSLQQALAVWRRAGDPNSIAFCLNVMATVALALGEAGRAEVYLQESLTLGQAHGNSWTIADTLKLLGQAARMGGQLAKAQKLFREGADLFYESSNHLGAAQTYQYLGETLLAEGNLSGAQEAYSSALLAAQTVRATTLILDILLSLAIIRVRRGAVAAAVEWLDCIRDHASARPETRERAAELHAELIATPMPPQLSPAYAPGSTAPLDEIVGRVLRDL